MIKNIEKAIDIDPEELNRLNERLSKIFLLKEKYGKTINDIKCYCEKAKTRLDYLQSLSEETHGIEKRRQILEQEVQHIAQRLSEERKKKALSIEKEIVKELGFLSMKDMDFNIYFTDKGGIDEDGKDDVELLISTNRGEPLRPLRKVASGGELSRIMLAIKKVMGGVEDRVLVFDEIDSGIGGKVAEMVGIRLKEISKSHQVICITHLPQIAIYGDHHFVVEKVQRGEKTSTNIKRLNRDERVMEIARMLGGIAITEKTIKRAEEMLEYAEKGKH